MVAKPRPDPEELRAYALGKLSDAESDRIGQILERDPECRAMLETLDAGDDTLAGGLRRPVGDDPYEVESQCDAALARAKGMAERPGEAAVDVSAAESRVLDGLGEYKVLDRLGRGGMGTVYKARHTKLDRIVAVKVIAQHRAGDPASDARFGREMKAIGCLDHPNIVRAYDAREIDGVPVLVMECVDGLDLGELIRRHGPLAVADGCELVRQAALGLQYAHEHGLVDRDVKPSNLMLARGGVVKILDLGLARFATPSDVRPPVGDLSAAAPTGTGGQAARGTPEKPAGASLTGTNQAMGTADYMAPEQIDDPASVDIRADVYALGCTLYKLLTGRAPFGDARGGTVEKLLAHASRPVRPIRELAPAVPETLAGVIARMLAKRREDRFATPAGVAAAIAPFCRGNNLPALLEKAEKMSAGRQLSQDHAQPAPQTAPSGRRFRMLAAMVAVAILFGSLGLATGILITIKKDGQTYQVDVPAGSRTVVDKEGNATVHLSEKEKRGPRVPSVEWFNLDRLDDFYDHVVVRVSFRLKKPATEQTLAEVKRLLGSLHGSFQTGWQGIGKTGWLELSVTDEALRVRQIRDMLREKALIDETPHYASAAQPSELAREDTSVVQVAEIETPEPLTWKWRIHLPKDSRYAVYVACGQIPASGVPKQGTWSTISNEPYWETGLDATITAALRQGEDKKWSITLKSRSYNTSCKLGDINLTLSDNALRPMFDAVAQETSVLGSRAPATLKPGEPIILLKRRGHDERPYSPTRAEAPGIMFWLQPIALPGESKAVVPDKEAIQGVWEVIDHRGIATKLVRTEQQVQEEKREFERWLKESRGSIDGPRQLLASGKGATVIFTDTLMKASGKGFQSKTARYDINPETNPKQIDIESGYHGVYEGIYKFEGDRLTICLSNKAHERPDGFWTGLRDDRELLVLRRVNGPLASDDKAPAEKDTSSATDDAPVEERFPHVLTFGLGQTNFAEGDDIQITEIRGTRPRFEQGGTYLVRGRYTLTSRDRASVDFYVTATDSEHGVEQLTDQRHSMRVERGSGQFAVEKTLGYPGGLHVSFYPQGGGDGFGGIYFGEEGNEAYPVWKPRDETPPNPSPTQ